MKTIFTKKQRDVLHKLPIGRGLFIYNSAPNVITEIKTYIAKDNTVRRSETGKPLFPVTFYDEGQGIINTK